MAETTRQQRRAAARKAAKNAESNGAKPTPAQKAAATRALKREQADQAAAAARASEALASLGDGVFVARVALADGGVTCIAQPVGNIDPMAVDSVLVKGLKGWRERLELNLD